MPSFTEMAGRLLAGRYSHAQVPFPGHIDVHRQSSDLEKSLR